MDDAVARSMAKWPEVPAVYGWLSLDRRGNWRIKGEKIANPALRDFIGRNYEPDARGCWYFQNGPQRVFVTLAYAPFVFHYEGQRLVDQCGGEVSARDTYLDDEGSVLILGERGVGLLDDRDLERYAERAERLLPIRRADAAARFGFVAEPSDSLR
jgi:Protein of unknown function (DUF2946)